MNIDNLLFQAGFIKEAYSTNEPMPQKFLENVLKLPEEQRKKAIIQRLNKWFQKQMGSIEENINDLKVEMASEKQEEQQEQKKEMLEQLTKQE